MKARLELPVVGALALGMIPGWGQNALLPVQPQTKPLTESGQVVVAGRLTPFLIRHLPVSSFPELPESVVVVLNRRGCVIPQTYEAHHPENAVHASLEHAGSSDWAVLCAVEGKVSLLVFFDGGAAGEAEGQPMELASAMEVDRLQAQPGSPVLGFNWGIDAASPQQVHEVQTGLENRPGRVDHDALADSVVERSTVYHFYARSAWTVLEMPE
jgi:hypothetical protein